jgi:hypothetical protein
VGGRVEDSDEHWSFSRCSAPFAKRTSGTRVKPAQRSAAVNERASLFCPANYSIHKCSTVFIRGTVASEWLRNVCNKNAVTERTLNDKFYVSGVIVHFTFLLLLAAGRRRATLFR